MADFEEMLDFPPAPKLDLFGKLDPAKATPAELHGQDIFFGKGQCGSCHQAPYYTDNLMHDLKTRTFLQARTCQRRDGGWGREHQDVPAAWH
jgi:cytochrome c peroxidase